jgi:hypothetical protein
MPPKSRQQRRPVVISDDDDASEKGAGDEVDQWVVGIVARAKDEDGNQYFLVRWGADDEGKPFDVGREEETWEPAEHVQGCPDALNCFHESSRPPLPSEKEAMQPALEREVAQLTTPGQAFKGAAGARAGLTTDPATDFLAHLSYVFGCTSHMNIYIRQNNRRFNTTAGPDIDGRGRAAPGQKPDAAKAWCASREEMLCAARRICSWTGRSRRNTRYLRIHLPGSGPSAQIVGGAAGVIGALGRAVLAAVRTS